MTKPVALGHIVAAASTLRRRDVSDVRRRLSDMGYVVPYPMADTDREDVILMSTGLDGAKPFLDSTRPIPAEHLIQIWLSGRDVGEAVRRLLRLGMRLPDGIKLATP